MNELQVAIKVDGLTRDFSGLVAVDHVSFQVNAGEIFGFLGPNGAGKTTTVKMLCTLLRPSAGKAWIADHDIEREQGQVRKSIGIIFQDPSLDDRLTARENLRFYNSFCPAQDPVSVGTNQGDFSDRANIGFQFVITGSGSLSSFSRGGGISCPDMICGRGFRGY